MFQQVAPSASSFSTERLAGLANAALFPRKDFHADVSVSRAASRESLYIVGFCACFVFRRGGERRLRLVLDLGYLLASEVDS